MDGIERNKTAADDIAAAKVGDILGGLILCCAPASLR